MSNPEIATNRDYVTSVAAMTSTLTVVATDGHRPGAEVVGEDARAPGRLAVVGDRRYDFDANLELLRRLMSKVEFVESGCWIWQGATSGSGYPRISIKRRLYMAHRVLLVLLGGAIDPELDIDHLCRVRLCVNPAHLEIVSRSENVRRAVVFRNNGVPKPKPPPPDYSKCRKGHPYDEDQIVRGNRRCRVCRAAYNALYAPIARERQRARRRGVTT